MKKLHLLLCAAACCAVMTTCASANSVILGYNDVSLSCGFQAAPCQELAGVSGSTLNGSGGLAQPGLYAGFSIGLGTQMNFSETGYSGHIDTLTFGSGTPASVNFPFSINLNQDVLASHTLSFKFRVTAVDPGHVGTSAIGFQDLDLNAPSSSSVPEPGSLTMLATGAFGLAGFLRRRFQS